jgi:hypothetical protein
MQKNINIAHQSTSTRTWFDDIGILVTVTKRFNLRVGVSSFLSVPLSTAAPTCLPLSSRSGFEFAALTSRQSNSSTSIVASSSDVVAELPTLRCSRAAPVSLFVGTPLVVDYNLKAKQDGQELALVAHHHSVRQGHSCLEVFSTEQVRHSHHRQ